MIFVDTSVFVYAVGREHPNRGSAIRFFESARSREQLLVTSAEVLQELLLVYIPVGRLKTLDNALELASGTITDVWSLEPEDVLVARSLLREHPNLSGRDLSHLASCIRRGVREIKTFDKRLRRVARTL